MSTIKQQQQPEKNWPHCLITYTQRPPRPALTYSTGLGGYGLAAGGRGFRVFGLYHGLGMAQSGCETVSRSRYGLSMSGHESRGKHASHFGCEGQGVGWISLKLAVFVADILNYSPIEFQGISFTFETFMRQRRVSRCQLYRDLGYFSM